MTLVRPLRAGWLSIALYCVLTSPAAAQQAVDPELKALIPDAAVADPESWARATPPAASPAPQANNELKPDSPLAELPDFRVSWPEPRLELPQFVSLTPDSDLAQALATAIEALPPPPPEMKGRGKHRGTEAEHRTARYTLAYPGDEANFPERAAFEQRFRA